MRFDMVSFICEMKSILIAAMFNVGASCTISAITLKGTGRSPGVT